VLLNENGDRVVDVGIERKDGWLEGRQVITGDIPKKKKEFIFLLPPADAEEIVIPEDLIQRFHDDDQITAWQEAAYRADKPEAKYRERDGWLGNKPKELGEPIFFLREGGSLTFIGRAKMFRLPYKQCPLDLVSKELRNLEDLDFADAIFGYVGKKQQTATQGTKTAAYAGRISVTQALTDEVDIFMPSLQIFPPKILGTPKPTAFQHYLVQKNESKRGLRHYDNSTEETTIRGSKRYWLQGNRTIDDLKALDPVPIASTQHTLIKPVRAGVSFSFRIYFENLSNEELGALCWTLHPLGDAQKTYCHQLGMGKPLGLGTVTLDATLHLNHRKDRYESLFAGNSWATGYEDKGLILSERGEQVKVFTDAFEAEILKQLNNPCQRLADLKRIAMLLRMMEWEDLLPTDQTRTQDLKNEFKLRRVLPDPSAWMSESERDRLVVPTPTQPAIVREDTPQSRSQNLEQSGLSNSLVDRILPTPPPSVPKPAEEEVTLVGNIKNGRAQVKTAQNEEILCEKMPTTAFQAPKRGDKVRAIVTRNSDGKATKAKYVS
jgi:CRISPR-associated protein (TIGR03986 family)